MVLEQHDHFHFWVEYSFRIQVFLQPLNVIQHGFYKEFFRLNAQPCQSPGIILNNMMFEATGLLESEHFEAAGAIRGHWQTEEDDDRQDPIQYKCCQ